MSKFIIGKELENAIYDIIWDAKDLLLIVSPFIKLDEYFKKLFDKHANNPKIHIIVVFGKNKGIIEKSLSKLDFDYFKKFLNISIVYVPNLHGKYYGNEHKGIITSINLYDYSFKKNLEFGVYSEVSLIDRFTTSTDQEAWATCMEIAENSRAIFIKRPVYDKGILSSIVGKNYIKSDILHDITNSFYNNLPSKSFMKIKDFQNELILGANTSIRPQKEEIFETIEGYCIRTGKRIPFNPKKPFCEKAYQSWAQYKNPKYPEKFCHKTGKPSNGLTSLSKPIL